MDPSEVNRRTDFFDQAARREKLVSPEMAQPTKATRYPTLAQPRIAYCKNDAGTGSTIVCYLDTDETGEEITVNCFLSNATNLSGCTRRLEDGDPIIVTCIGGTWYAKEGFQGTEDCECYSS